VSNRSVVESDEADAGGQDDAPDLRRGGDGDAAGQSRRSLRVADARNELCVGFQLPPCAYCTASPQDGVSRCHGYCARRKLASMSEPDDDPQQIPGMPTGMCERPMPTSSLTEAEQAECERIHREAIKLLKKNRSRRGRLRPVE
jgi:hypothetical protein